LSALDSLTGDELWAYNAGSSITHFEVSDDWVVLLKRVFARDVLVVLSASTGEVIWQREGLIRSFYLSDNQLFAAFEGYIRAYDVTTGEQLWDNQEAATSHWETHLVYEKGLLYVEAETLRVLDADTGDFLKEFDLQTAPGRTIIFKGMLYTANDWNEELLAVNGLTGEIVWRKRIPLARYRHTPDLIDGILYVTTEEGHLLAIDRNDGSLLWEYSDSPAVRVISNIVILHEVVYAVFADDTLRGIDALTGHEVGHLQAEGIERPSIGDYFGIAKMAIAGDLLLVTFDGLTLLALQPQ
jgi:outer membrane protein assembly factor BamB